MLQEMGKVKSSLRSLGKVPVVGRVLLGLFRLKIGLSPVLGTLKELLPWLVRSREYTNFTYDLTDLNKEYLASFVAAVTGTDRNTALRYIQELEEDDVLRSHIDERTQASGERHFADRRISYGKRLGWYAIARIVKPRVVVETGVEKGLGACVLAAALLRNKDEGFPGNYYDTDIQPRAGYLLQGKYADVGRILYGDSITSLETLDATLDLFINDSDHSSQYERREYETIQHKLAEDAIIIGDNAHETRNLLDFAIETDRDFLFFQEKPYRHWYRGGGIGVAFRRA